MGILKKVRDKTGTIHELGDSRVDAFETELSGAEHNVPYSPAVLAKTNAIEASVSEHTGNTANPHGVTKEQLGLANVENKSSMQIRSEITKENVTNALGYTPIDESRIGAANGVASLDAGGRIPASQIPGGFDNIDEYDSLADFPETGEEGKIYVARDTNLTYRWTGTQYVEISPSLALGETATTAYRGDRGKAAYEHSQVSGDSTIHHVHDNKELLDSYTQTEADLANAVARVHEHGNKAVLDGITAEKVKAWDSKMDKQTVGSESVPVYLENGIAKEATGVATKEELEAQGNVVLTYNQTPTKNDGTAYTFAELTAIALEGRLFCVRNNVLYRTVTLSYIKIRLYSSSDLVHYFCDLSSSLAWTYNTSTGVHISQVTAAINALDAEVESTDGKNVQVKVTEIDGKITAVNVTTDDTASAQSVKDEATARANADTALQGNLDAESTARSDADTALGSRISTLEGKTKLSDFTDDITTGTYSETGSAPVNGQAVASAVGAEATARSDADTALGARIDTVDAKGLTVKEIDGEQVLCFE